MKIVKINLELKFSKEIRDGEWKGISLGAEATVDQKETAREARQALQNILAQELRLAWAESRRTDLPRQEAQPAVGDEKIEEAPVDPLLKAALEMGGVPPKPVDPSWCDIHKVKMKFRSWGGYSHKLGEQWCQGHWCLKHRQPFKKFEKEGGTWWSHSYEDRDTGETLWCREDGEQGEIPSQ